MSDKKCNRCKKILKLLEFQKDGKELNNCNECREKIREYRSQKNTEKIKELNEKYKAENKDRIKLMNLFYRSTKNFSDEEKKILKEQFQKEHGIISTIINQPSKHRKEHSFQNDIEGKECSVPNCGWHPLTEYNNSSLDWDGLRKTCKKCLQISRKNSKNKLDEKKITENENLFIKEIKDNNNNTKINNELI